MPIKPEYVLARLDIDPEKFEDEKAFDEHFDKDWIRVKEAAKNKTIQGAVIGQKFGSIRTRGKAAARDLELEGVDVTDQMEPEELFDLFATGVKSKLEKTGGRITELEKAVKAKGNDEAYKELERKYGELEKKHTDVGGQVSTWEKKYNELHTSVESQKKTAKEDALWDRAYGGVKFRQGMSEFEKDGFKSGMRKKYELGFDEQGVEYAQDAVTKNRIPDPNKAQTWLSLDQLVLKEAQENKLHEINPHGGQPAHRPAANAPTPQPTGGKVREMPINPFTPGATATA